MMGKTPRKDSTLSFVHNLLLPYFLTYSLPLVKCTVEAAPQEETPEKHCIVNRPLTTGECTWQPITHQGDGR